MKSSAKIIISVAIVAVTASIIYRRMLRSRCGDILTEVSDEGYETAHDILFPGKRRGGKLHYGPVLPFE